MRTLLILRHGKSSWQDAGLTDHDRPLKKRGRENAVRMGRLIAAERLVPDLILSSSARRARDTASRVAGVWGEEAPPLRFDRTLYHAGPEALVDALHDLHPGNPDTVLLVGHNPGLEELVESLTGEVASMPTAALAHITLPIDDWLDLRLRARGMLVKCWCPRELPEP